MRWQTFLKRATDIVLSSVALLVLWPLLLLIAVAIRINMGAPIFFRQGRPGLDGKLFTLIKFRTMHDLPNGLLSIPRENALPLIGRLLRKTGLDELPELFNVLCNDMSLVGPRPLLAEYLEYYSDEHQKRHTVKPGITGLAQVNGRQDLVFSKRLDMDVWYVNHWSVFLDWQILFKTLYQMGKAEGIAAQSATIAEVDDLGLTRALRSKN